MNEAEKERLIKKDIVSIENRVRHAFNQGYEMGMKENKEQSGDEELDFVPEHKKIPCTLIIGKPCEDAISRAEALRHSHIEYDDDGEGHRVVYVEDIEELPSVTPKGVTITDFADRCRECGKQKVGK